MIFVYRVLPFLASASHEDPGGALHVPPQGAGRLDAPDRYSVLYVSDAAAGAIAETFGRFPEWAPAMLAGSPALPGSVRALATYRLTTETRVCDLDDPAQLLARNLRPSDVVSREYSRTRGWARRVHGERRWIGVRWWSYYDARWASMGLWDVGGLALDTVRPLRLDDPALVEASRIIVRRIVRAPT
jgi:hypothetical protein